MNENPSKGASNERTEAPEFITVETVRQILSCSERTVRGWIADGTLPAFKAGRMVRIRRSDALAIFKPMTRS